MMDLQYMQKKEFYKLHEKIGQYNIGEYFKFFESHTLDKKLLDLGCGEGNDMRKFIDMGFDSHGIDINPEAIKEARKILNLDSEKIRCASAYNIPFQKETFDVVASNYVLQAIDKLDPVISEVSRILKPGGEFIFLATHPMRQYFERKDKLANYFYKDVVDSVILNGTVTVKEPTHTMNEYLSQKFLSHFEVEKFVELVDPTAEKVDDRFYPGFFIIKARKR